MTAARLGGRFVLGSSLGAGGMGSLFRAHDERLEVEVAIKLLKRAHVADPILRERFRREALALSRLRHPGIVQVYDFGETEDGDLYLALELVRGRTLADVVASDAPLTLERAAPLFDQILAALETCHAHAIVHRDVKPSNIMVAQREEDNTTSAKLIDFGLARIETAANVTLTETGAVQGTPLYMAPEQCRGEAVGAEADIYSAGVVFYEALSGEAPFQGGDAATFMAQHLFVDPPPLGQLAPSTSKGVAAVVHAALAKRPHDRPTARAFRDALSAALRGEDPQTAAETASRERRRTSTLERSDRAIGAVPLAQAESATGRVVVWMAVDARSAAIRSCLGAAGFQCEAWSDDAVPELDANGDDVLVVAASAVSRAARVHADQPRLPIVVVDVASPEETTAAIRAGASDMLLREAPDADLAPRIARLLRRQQARRRPR